MRLVHTLLAVAIGTALAAGATAYAGSGGAAAQKQRIAIDMVVHEMTQTATFTLKPLTSGPIKSDKGTVTLCCVVDGGRPLRNGMSTYNASMSVGLHGGRGTLRLRQFIDQNEMQNGMCGSAWEPGGSRKAPTRTQVSRAAAATSPLRCLPCRRRFVRQEGWVTVPG